MGWKKTDSQMEPSVLKNVVKEAVRREDTNASFLGVSLYSQRVVYTIHPKCMVKPLVGLT